MIYTKTELEKVKENIAKIRDYLKTIRKKLGDGHTVFFKYDGCKYSLHLTMLGCNSYIEGAEGGYRIVWENDGAVDISHPKTEYFIGVICNWHEIKRQFEEEVNRRENVKKALLNFEI